MLPTECDAFLHIWACMMPITLSRVLLLGSSIMQLSTWVCLCSWHSSHPPWKKVKWLRHLPTSSLGDLRRVWEIYHIYHVNDIYMKYNVNVNIIYNMIFRICLKMIQHKKRGWRGTGYMKQDWWNAGSCWSGGTELHSTTVPILRMFENYLRKKMCGEASPAQLGEYRPHSRRPGKRDVLVTRHLLLYICTSPNQKVLIWIILNDPLILSKYLPFYPPIYLSTSICLSSTYPSTYLSNPSIHPSYHPSSYLTDVLRIYPSTCPSTHLSSDLSSLALGSMESEPPRRGLNIF